MDEKDLKLSKIGPPKKDDGFINCKVCDGYGHLHLTSGDPGKDGYVTWVQCWNCQGVGQISWVDKVLKGEKFK